MGHDLEKIPSKNWQKIWSEISGGRIWKRTPLADKSGSNFLLEIFHVKLHEHFYVKSMLTFGKHFTKPRDFFSMFFFALNEDDILKLNVLSNICPFSATQMLTGHFISIL